MGKSSSILCGIKTQGMVNCEVVLTCDFWLDLKRGPEVAVVVLMTSSCGICYRNLFSVRPVDAFLRALEERRESANLGSPILFHMHGDSFGNLKTKYSTN